MKLRITYNAPVVLTFAIVAASVQVLNTILGGAVSGIVSLQPGFSFSNPIDYLTLFSYTVGHQSFAHLLGNMTIFLLLGPILEEKYGSKKLLLFMGITALATAIIHLLFFSGGAWGSSGLVFMFIMLASLVNVRSGEVPLSFILVAILFLGTELFSSFREDQVSQFAHIFGGICGSVFGFVGSKRIGGKLLV